MSDPAVHAEWHAGPYLLTRYAAGRLDEAAAWSVEAHVERCARCRAEAVPLVAAGRTAATWAAIAAALDAPAPRPVERMLLAAGVADHTARLLAATRSLTLSWFAAVGLSLAFALGAAWGSDDGALLFLALAPLLPLAGIAAAYGPGVDPGFEIGVAAPMHGFRLLLLRAVAVLVSTCALVGAAAILLPPVPGLAAAAWLLPALGLALAALATTRWAGVGPAAGGLAACWLLAVSSAAALDAAPAVFGPAAQAGFALLALASTALLARRHAVTAGGDR